MRRVNRREMIKRTSAASALLAMSQADRLSNLAYGAETSTDSLPIVFPARFPAMAGRLWCWLSRRVYLIGGSTTAHGLNETEPEPRHGQHCDPNRTLTLTCSSPHLTAAPERSLFC